METVENFCLVSWRNSNENENEISWNHDLVCMTMVDTVRLQREWKIRKMLIELLHALTSSPECGTLIALILNFELDPRVGRMKKSIEYSNKKTVYEYNNNRRKICRGKNFAYNPKLSDHINSGRNIALNYLWMWGRNHLALVGLTGGS